MTVRLRGSMLMVVAAGVLATGCSLGGEPTRSPARSGSPAASTAGASVTPEASVTPASPAPPAGLPNLSPSRGWTAALQLSSDGPPTGSFQAGGAFAIHATCVGNGPLTVNANRLTLRIPCRPNSPGVTRAGGRTTQARELPVAVTAPQGSRWRVLIEVAPTE